MMLTYQQKRKMHNQSQKMFHLYAYLSVLMQMDMAYAHKASTKTFLGVIANKVSGLQTKLDKILSKATTSDEYEGGEDIRNVLVGQMRVPTADSEALVKIEALKKINKQYSNICGACELIGIKLKNTKYSVHDCITFANRV